jgi:hypothetical protein
MAGVGAAWRSDAVSRWRVCTDKSVMVSRHRDAPRRDAGQGDEGGWDGVLRMPRGTD